MSKKLRRCIIIFGGFRTTSFESSRAVVTALKALNVDKADYVNLWDGQGESLEKRFNRSANWLRFYSDQSVELHILGHSMGCQLAVKFAEFTQMSLLDNWRFGQLILSAPDPKYRRGPWDLIENQAGETPAYDEASMLWATAGAAGPCFTDTLRHVAGAFKRGVRVVFCKDDKVAEWHQNVEIMKSRLNSCSAIKWIEALPNAVVNNHGIRISLKLDEIAHIESADQHHEVLWRRLEICS